MSYEFRTPLTSIGGFAELLQSGVAGELTPQAQEYLAAILSAVERLRAQIETVLDLTQSEAGLLPIATAEVELLAFVTQRGARARGGDRGQGPDARSARRQGRRAKSRPTRASSGGRSATCSTTRSARPPRAGASSSTLSRRKKGARIVISDNGRGDEAERARPRARRLSRSARRQARERAAAGSACRSRAS